MTFHLEQPKGSLVFVRRGLAWPFGLAVLGLLFAVFGSFGGGSFVLGFFWGWFLLVFVWWVVVCFPFFWSVWFVVWRWCAGVFWVGWAWFWFVLVFLCRMAMTPPHFRLFRLPRLADTATGAVIAAP